MLPSVSTPIVRLAPPALGQGAEDRFHHARVFAAGGTAGDGHQLLRARAPAVDRAQRVLELLGNDLVRARVDARRADVDLRGEALEVALARWVPPRRCRDRRAPARRRAARPATALQRVARALVDRAAVDAQQVAGLVLLRLDADHAASRVPPSTWARRRRAQAFPVLEVVALVQPQRRVVVHERRAARRSPPPAAGSSPGA